MVTSYHIVPYLQNCYASLVMYTRLLKVLHEGCNTDVLWALPIYLHSPLGAARPWDRAYISDKPLTTVLQPINVYCNIITVAN